MQRPDVNRIFIWLTYLFTFLVWLTGVMDPAMRRPETLIPFTVAALAYGALHGALPHLHGPVWPVLYVIGQTILATAVMILSSSPFISPWLLFPVLGEGIGLFPDWKRRVGVLALIAAGYLGGMLAIGGGGFLLMSAPWTVLACIFVAVYVILFTRQAAERQRAEQLLAQLTEAHAQLRSYSVQIEELSVTQERQRMARELHDTLAQGLAGLIMQLEAIDDLLGRGKADKAREVTGRAMDRARTTLRDARKAIQALRSPLERGDLVEAVRREVDNLRAETDMECVLEAGPGDLRLTGQVAEQLYRVVQEGLTNVARHSQAGQVTVRLGEGPDGVVLEITDDGVGFDPARVPAGHFGLVGLQERVRLAGGVLTIDSCPGQGTRLQAVLPHAAVTAQEE